MNYSEALQYIKDRTKFGMKLGLERISAILSHLGNPQEKFPSIHIAGTNGKGSTTAMFEVVLREAGLKTARFTSPHLSDYRERFVVDGAKISEDELAAVVTNLQPALDAVIRDGYGEPTEFEVGTAIAFSFFAASGVDIAVIEVGMGGRFDATNVLTPVLSVITRLALDHQQYLGNTLREIAFEKAGIIKAGVPVVIGAQEDPETEAYLEGIAMERGARSKRAGAVSINNVRISADGTLVEYEGTEFGSLTVDLKLIGRHQATNCLNVLAGVEMLRRHPQNGIFITHEQLVKGLTRAVWPGRMERLDNFAPVPLFFDGAHNPDGALALAETLRTIYPGRKVEMMMGVLNNRPLPEIAAILAPVAARVITTTVPDPKSTHPEELAGIFQGMGVPALAVADPVQALEMLKENQSGGPAVVVTGSLYLVGLVRRWLHP